MTNKIEEAIKRFNLLKETNLKDVKPICDELLKILNDCNKNLSLVDLNKLIDFARDVYNKIQWEKPTSGFNTEYMIILVEILNIFLVNNKKQHFTDFEISKEDFSRVLKIIEAFRR